MHAPNPKPQPRARPTSANHLQHKLVVANWPLLCLVILEVLLKCTAYGPRHWLARERGWAVFELSMGMLALAELVGEVEGGLHAIR